MTTFYALGSLGLGLLAWILAGVSLRRQSFGLCNLYSGAACALALLLQLMEIDHRANGLGDFSAIMDTVHVVVMAGWVLLVVTVALNGFAYLAAKSKR